MDVRRKNGTYKITNKIRAWIKKNIIFTLVFKKSNMNSDLNSRVNTLYLSIKVLN